MDTAKERYLTYRYSGKLYHVRYIPESEDGMYRGGYILYDATEDDEPKEIGVIKKVRGGYEGYLLKSRKSSPRNPVKCRSIKDLVYFLDREREQYGDE